MPERGSGLAMTTYGHARQRAVPQLEGTTPKVCRRCDCWFASRSREAVCDGCVPASERTKRALRDHDTGTAPRPGIRAGQRGVKSELQSGLRVVRSEALGLTFRCPV